MNRGEIIETVLARIGRSEGNAYLLGRAAVEIKTVQNRLEGGAFMPWFLLSGVQDLTTTANTRELALPTGFLREYEDYPLYRYDASAEDPYIRLNKDEFDVLETRYEGEEAGIPLAYALVGEELHFFPTPDDAYPLKWNYFEKKAVLVGDDSENAWTENAEDLLIAELGLVMARYRVDVRDNNWKEDREEARKRLLAFDEARKQALRNAYRGDPD